MDRYVRELRETSEKLCASEAALHCKMNGLLQQQFAVLTINHSGQVVIVMTHWPVSDACFWYQLTGSRNWSSVCHTFLVPDFSGARNWRRLEHVQFRAGNRLEN